MTSPANKRALLRHRGETPLGCPDPPPPPLLRWSEANIIHSSFPLAACLAAYPSPLIILKFLLISRKLFTTVLIRVVYKTFHFHKHLPTDVLETFGFNFSSDADALTVKACIESSPSRVIGALTRVPPVGVTLDGSDFEYYNSPHFAVLSKTKITSVENCRMYGKSNWCDIVKTTCTIASFDFCPVRKVPMFDGVFTMELDSSTFVATTLKKFVVWNGSHAHVEDVYESGQFMLELQVGWQAYFGRVTVVGNAGSFHDMMLSRSETVDSFPTSKIPIRLFENDQEKVVMSHELLHAIEKLDVSGFEDKILAMPKLSAMSFREVFEMIPSNIFNMF